MTITPETLATVAHTLETLRHEVDRLTLTCATLTMSVLRLTEERQIAQDHLPVPPHPMPSVTRYPGRRRRLQPADPVILGCLEAFGCAVPVKDLHMVIVAQGYDVHMHTLRVHLTRLTQTGDVVRGPQRGWYRLAENGVSSRYGIHNGT